MSIFSQSNPDRITRLKKYAPFDTSSEEYDDIVSLAGSICDTPIAFISFETDERVWLKSAIGIENSDSTLVYSLCAKTILSDNVLTVADCSKDERFRNYPYFLRGKQVLSYAGASLVTSDGYRIGTLSVMDVVPREFSEKQINGLIALSRNAIKFLDLNNKVETLIEQNHFNQSVIDFIPGMIGYWDTELRCCFANRAYHEWFGRTAKEMIGMKIQDVLGETIYKKNEPFILGALNGVTQRFERAIPKPDGKLGYTWAQYIPDISEGKVKGFVVLVTDITELKLTEISLKEAEKKLNEILESMPEGLVEVNLNGEIIYANKGAERILSIKETEIAKRYFNSKEWRQVDSIGNPYPLDQLPLAIAMREKREVGPIEHGIVDEEGNQKWLSVHALPLLDKDNNLYGAIASFRDVTERNEFQKKLIEAKNAADNANKAKSEFLANMSHEIRTPMNAILGFSEILNRKLTDENLKQYALSIITSGRVLLKLINDVLDLSKIESGKFELNNSVVHFKKMFEEMQIIFSQKLEEKGLKLDFIISEELPDRIVLDELRLRQILLNLIGNAVKFTHTGYIKVSAKQISYNSKDNTVELLIEVEDTGIGIPKKDQSKIFDAFTQRSGQDHNVYGGTGLGLTIARKLIKLMNGEIFLHSEINQGTRFEIVLKNLEVFSGFSINANLGSEENFDILENEFHFEPGKILVVDDIFVNRQLVRNFLEDFSNLIIIEAENGKLALEAVEENRPDLILMDIKMPVMNGVEAIQILKSNNKTKDIPIIALTASAFEQTKTEVIDSCDGYLQKPVSRKNLIEKISEFLNYKVESKQLDIEESQSENEVRLSLSNVRILIKSIASDTMKKLEDLIEVIDVAETVRLAKQIKSLGKEYEYKPLYLWGRDLEIYADRFDIDKIISLLKQFPDLMDELKKISS
ncbi:MAG: PAS domain S-box protein [Leptospiraceae bacterium]|nr:PAS domain S-box protein [Leptospiraceae bacterium]